jgi:outer membrane protein TolC
MGLAFLACALPSIAQEANPQPASVEPQTLPASAPAAAPLRLTLQDALDRARKNSTQFQAALTNAALARQDRAQARNALLPTVTYDNSAI